MALSKEEIQSIRHESKGENRVERKADAPKSRKKIAVISGISAAVLLIAVSFAFSYANSSKPGPLDGFARCLTEKGAVMYGASFCQYTHAQEGMFGNSAKFIDSRDFSEDSNVRVTPTWLINGNYYQNVQTFDRLSAITGCAIG
jgi:hypothetical protein